MAQFYRLAAHRLTVMATMEHDTPVGVLGRLADFFPSDHRLPGAGRCRCRRAGVRASAGVVFLGVNALILVP
jgi:hypothetical protein